MLLTACSTPEKRHENLYKGELFIKLITVGPEIFSVEDEDGVSLYDKISSIKDTSGLDYSNKDLKAYFDFLSDNDLFGASYFYIKMRESNNEIATVYINEEEFKKVSRFTFAELNKNNQKVIIEFYGRSLLEGNIKASEIKSVSVVDGITERVK